MPSAARRLFSSAAAILAAGFCSTAANAAEVEVKIDSLVGGAGASVCACFVAGEEAAVWLTSPCDGSIVALQIFWRSQFGGAQQTIEDSIIISQSGNYPTPGVIKDELLAPVMTDGVMNEYRFEDQNQTIPINIPVTSGEEFVVSFKFFNQNAGDIFAPSIVFDADGITPNKNAIKANPGGWIRSEDAGVTGDWVIRAIIDCAAGDPTGACCLPDGSCADGLTAAQCAAQSGVFQGALSTCGTLNPPCPQPTGACCFSGGGCLDLTDADCTTASGSWLGANTDCADCACDGDPNGDFTVDVNDISYVLFRLGDPCPAPGCDGDANGDGTVDVNDISYVLFRLGNPC